jgi:DNA repair exonuclease SbcCD ATPase subunit
MNEDTRAPCSQHPQIMEWFQELIRKIGKHDAHIETSLANQNEIFERLRAIQSTLDQRTLVNVGIDKQIERLTEVAEANQKNIDQLKAHVENGLSDRTKSIENSVSCLRECMEKFESERKLKEAIAEAGLPGFFNQSWAEVKKKLGPAIIYLILGLLGWAFIKAVIFQEYPFPNGVNLHRNVVGSEVEERKE